MFKFVNKRLRNRKGFTLIELIVVIAILGILALIAIPRFAGFTDRAKIQSDEQYAALVGNSLVVMLASGDYSVSGSAVFDIDNSTTGTNVSVVSGVGYGGAKLSSDTELIEALEKLVSPTPLQYFNDMDVTVTEEGGHSAVGNE
ncbi:MAG: type II secretion system protein [Bacillota bacterium]|nr:type II secretion system protein [Bacillota bacterium]